MVWENEFHTLTEFSGRAYKFKLYYCPLASFITSKTKKYKRYILISAQRDPQVAQGFIFLYFPRSVGKYNTRRNTFIVCAVLFVVSSFSPSSI